MLKEEEHVDAFMCNLQSALAKIKALRFCSLSVRLGMAGAPALTDETGIKEKSVAKIIEFYIPTSFQKKDKWIPAQNRGRMIEFKPQTTKSA